MTPEDERRAHARGERLRRELDDEEHRLDFGEEVINDLVIEELAYARYVPIHEGIFPNYGALITGNGAQLPEDARPREGSPSQAMRKFADGESSFILRREETKDTISLVDKRLADEREIVELCYSTGGIFVRRLSSGNVTVTSKDRVLVNEGYRWWSRPVASTRSHVLNDVLRLSSIGIRPLFFELLEFAFHQLSPLNIGATLVVDVQGDATKLLEHLAAKGGKPPFELNLTDESDARAMVTFLRVVDGACLIASDGRVVRTEAKLATSRQATTLLSPSGGMRHSSAKWFSYDNPGVVVIVVSADGPVSLFSSGAKIAAFDTPPPPMLQAQDFHQGDREEFVEEETEETCARCCTTLRVVLASHPSSAAPHDVKCPVCEGPIAVMIASDIRVYPKKPWFSPIRS